MDIATSHKADGLDRRVQVVLRNLSDCGECAEVVRGWLVDDARQANATRKSLLNNGASLGLEICGTFNDRFASYFECGQAKLGTGVQVVTRTLNSNLGGLGRSLPDRPIEAVLDNILDSRRKYLDKFRERYQPSLLIPLAVKFDLVDGYFFLIAVNESRAVPVDSLPWGTLEFELLEYDAGRSDSEETEVEDVDLACCELRNLVQITFDFWDRNGFTVPQRLEGKVSAGLGSYLTDETLAAKANDVFLRNCKEMQAALDKLDATISAKLAKLDLANWRADSAGEEDARDESLQKARAYSVDLDKLRRRRSEEAMKLMPTVSQVKEVLDDQNFNVANVRNTRLTREVEVLKRRVDEGAEQLISNDNADQNVVQTARAYQAWNLSRPPSSSQHGLDADEKLSRQRRKEAWELAGAELAVQAQAVCVSLINSSHDDSCEIVWLWDILNYLEYGVNRRGIVPAIRCLEGRRREALLRYPVESAGSEENHS